MKNYCLKISFQLLLFILPIAATAQGGWQWAVSHGDDVSTPDEYVENIQTDQWGNIYVSGSINDIFKRDSAGNVLYDPFFYPLIYNHGNQDIWVAKYSPNGKNLWHRYAGSGAADFLISATTDDLGNTYVLGNMGYNAIRRPHSFNWTPLGNDSLLNFIAKIDSGGNLLWHKPFGYDSLGQRSVCVTNGKLFIDDRNVIHFLTISCRDQIVFNTDTIEDVWYDLTFSASGDYLNAKRLPFIDYYHLPFSAIEYDMDKKGNYYFMGQFPGDTLFMLNDTIVRNSQNSVNGLVMAIDSASQLKWSFVSNNVADNFNDGQVLGDTVFLGINFSVFSGDTIAFDSVNFKPKPGVFQEGALLLMDANTGGVIGMKHSTGTSSTTTWNNSVKANKDFMAVGGKFNRKMTYSGTTNYMESVSKSSSSINSDNFFALFDRQGNFLCEDFLYTFGFFDGVTEITFVDSTIYVAGFFNDTLFVGGDTLIARGKNDVFLARYDLPCGKGIPVGVAESNNYIKAEKGVLIYPNPASEFTNLVGKPVHNEGHIINIIGQIVRTVSLETNVLHQQVSLSGLEPGIYFLTIVSSQEKQVLKILKN